MTGSERKRIHREYRNKHRAMTRKEKKEARYAIYLEQKHIVSPFWKKWGLEQGVEVKDFVTRTLVAAYGHPQRVMWYLSQKRWEKSPIPYVIYDREEDKDISPESMRILVEAPQTDATSDHTCAGGDFSAPPLPSSDVAG
jgi:hypothetical protein